MATILVVDNAAICREPIAACLRQSGHETLTASDGQEALDLARARRPDLVVLDVLLSKTDGISFLRQLRADPRVAATRVIVLTAASEKSVVLSAASLGVTEYLLKSRFKLAHLLERVERQLKGGGGGGAAAKGGVHPKPAGAGASARNRPGSLCSGPKAGVNRPVGTEARGPRASRRRG